MHSRGNLNQLIQTLKTFKKELEKTSVSFSYFFRKRALMEKIEKLIQAPENESQQVVIVCLTELVNEKSSSTDESYLSYVSKAIIMLVEYMKCSSFFEISFLRAQKNSQISHLLNDVIACKEHDQLMDQKRVGFESDAVALLNVTSEKMYEKLYQKKMSQFLPVLQNAFREASKRVQEFNALKKQKEDEIQGLDKKITDLKHQISQKESPVLEELKAAEKDLTATKVIAYDHVPDTYSKHAADINVEPVYGPDEEKRAVARDKVSSLQKQLEQIQQDLKPMREACLASNNKQISVQEMLKQIKGQIDHVNLFLSTVKSWINLRELSASEKLKLAADLLSENGRNFILYYAQSPYSLFSSDEKHILEILFEEEKTSASQRSMQKAKVCNPNANARTALPIPSAPPGNVLDMKAAQQPKWIFQGDINAFQGIKQKLDEWRALLNREIDAKDYADAASNILCPISQEIMSEPVLTPDGHCYDKKSIIKHIDLARDQILSPQIGHPYQQIPITLIPLQISVAEITAYLASKIKLLKSNSSISLNAASAILRVGATGSPVLTVGPSASPSAPELSDLAEASQAKRFK